MKYKKNYTIPKRLFWVLFFFGMFMGGFFVFIAEHPISESDGSHGCFTQYDLVGPCSQNMSVVEHPQDYTQLVPFENESGKFWRCKVQNWTVRAC